MTLNDLLHSNFNNFTTKKTKVIFVDGVTFDVFHFQSITYDVLDDSLRIIIKK